MGNLLACDLFYIIERVRIWRSDLVEDLVRVGEKGLVVLGENIGVSNMFSLISPSVASTLPTKTEALRVRVFSSLLGSRKSSNICCIFAVARAFSMALISSCMCLQMSNMLRDRVRQK